MATLTQQIAELQSLVSQASSELQSLQNGKKASAPRIRASLQKIKTVAQAMRGGVMQFTKELPTKSRTKVAPIETTSDEEPPPPPVLKRETTTLTGEESEPKKKRVPRKKPIEEITE